ncbi:hypothetical protein Sme01_23010 [Sphaerisporangium melleum]|uniref:Uncharacterized protein n=1 Tax=Sphaerisporangium melleum TaxID=321316 RepID=A0A917QZW1_9ACTN|nr:GPP34 family phosphoprotein [Sphaerisporangium melleum]GGK78361.1 hypothetical protein GCM10007964_21360 [Sphaerisporangium melleum]GII69825.1 hypothetical protein Sme01_23010 [Sphaerisporangium melleum]
MAREVDMRKFRISLGLVLLALAGIVVWIAWEPSANALIAWLALWPAAAVLVWKAFAAFAGRITPSRTAPQSPLPTRPGMPQTPTNPPWSPGSPDALSSPIVSPDQKPLDTGTPPPAVRTDYLDVMQEAGKAAKSALIVMARVMVVLVLCIFVPGILIVFFVGMSSLFQGKIPEAASAFLVVGWLGWYCWGPLRDFWNAGGDAETRTDKHETAPSGRTVAVSTPRTDGRETASSSRTAAVDAPRMSLPEEFLLLSHGRHGNVHDHDRSVVGCAAAELGELALRRRLRLAPHWMINFWGITCFFTTAEIHVLDLTPTGIGWADDLLTELGRLSAPEGHPASDPTRTASPSRPILLQRWLRLRGDRAFLLHREAMIERGLLFYSPGFRPEHEERHYPDAALRTMLIDWLRAVNSAEVPADEQSLLLRDLVDGAGLNKELGLNRSIRQLRDQIRRTGTVAAVPKDMENTSDLLTLSFPRRMPVGTNADAGNDDGDDGGE